MSLFLKLFETTAQYNTYTADTANFIKPNVSYCQDAMSVHYTPVISIANAVITCDSATYNGQTQVATNIVVTLNGNTLVSGTDYTVSNNDGGVNAGNYTFTIDGIGNYSDSKDGTFTIGKVTPTVTTPTAKVLTYNGSAQELVNAGSTNYGTLKYSSDGTSYSTSIPTATNYGSYTVYYKVEGDSNVNDVAPATLQCSINEKQVTATVELSQSTYTYDGSAKEPTVTVKDGSTVIPSSEYSVAYSNNTNAGTATVTISDNVGGNYEVIGSATFTINKASRTMSWVNSPSNVISGSSVTVEAAPSVGDGTITYSSSDTTKATVNGNVVSGVGVGSCTITATISEGTNYLSANTSYSLTIDYPYVEIAGTKWATMNIGANSVTDIGLYFAWGDTQGYTAAQVGSGAGQKYFGWEDYKYGNGTSSPGDTGMTKYNYTDGKTVLDISDDAARANWGGSWRMPTTAEYAALGAAVNAAWTADYQGSGVAGLVCTDKTDSSKVLFFPADGGCYNGSVSDVGSDGYYWSSSVNSSHVRNAYSLNFNNYGGSYVDWQQNGDFRCFGDAVRGVLDE